MVEQLARITGLAYEAKEYKSLEQCLSDIKDPALSPMEHFSNAIFANYARGILLCGFQPPLLVDIPASYGWETDDLNTVCNKILPGTLPT
jgi:hypothetical protein